MGIKYLMKTKKLFLIILIVFLIYMLNFFLFNKTYEYENYKITTSLFSSTIEDTNSGNKLHRNKRILDYSLGDINNDGIMEIGIIYAHRLFKNGGVIEIISLGDTFNSVYNKDLSSIKPWKIEIGDITGNGISEIALGIIKETPHHRIKTKRCFVYNLDFTEKKLVARFRASRFVRPFLTFSLYDIDEDNILEILAIEINSNKSNLISGYKWKGFGFNLDYTSNDFNYEKGFDKRDNNIYVNDKRLKLVENNIILEGEK